MTKINKLDFIQEGKLTKIGAICLVFVLTKAMQQFFNYITENDSTKSQQDK